MEQLYLVGFLGAAAAILFAWGQSRRVLSYSEGSETMQKIAAAIRSGADAYLKHSPSSPGACGPCSPAWWA